MEAIKLCRLDTPIIFIEARINLSRFVVIGCAAKTSATVTFPKIGRAVQRNAETDLVCRLLLEKKKLVASVGAKFIYAVLRKSETGNQGKQAKQSMHNEHSVACPLSSCGGAPARVRRSVCGAWIPTRPRGAPDRRWPDPPDRGAAHVPAFRPRA